MNERQRTINQAFEAYAKIRRQAPRDVVERWVSLSLMAGSIAPLSHDERLTVEAAADCGWMAPYTEPAEPDASGFDGLPDATTTTATTATAELPGRCTLWD